MKKKKKKTASQKLDDIDHQIKELYAKRNKLSASVAIKDTKALKAKFVGKWVTLGGWGTYDEHAYDKASGGDYRIFRIDNLRKFAPGEYRMAPECDYRLIVSDELNLRSDNMLFCRTKKDQKCDIKNMAHLKVISNKELARVLHKVNRNMGDLLKDMVALEKSLDK